MEQAEVQQLYTEKAAFYHKIFVDLALYGKGLKAAVGKYAPLRGPMRVLDAGCGTGIQGRNLHAIARERNLQDITYNGFDLTPAMTDIFKVWIAKENATEITLRQGNVLHTEDLPETWNGYDFVVSSGMLEYLNRDQLVNAIRNLKGLLRDDGTMMVFITRKNFLMKWLIHVWWGANMYTRDDMEGIFREAGLSPVFRSFPFPYIHLNLWGLVIEAKKMKGEGGPA